MRAEFKIALIVDKIINDMSGRKGLGDEWDNIDHDVRDELRETWEQLVRDVMLA